MYLKLSNEVIEKYPYSIGELRRDNPQTSFPKNPSDQLLAEWQVFPVTPTPQPQVDHTKNVAEVDPVKTGDTWVQTWQVTDASQEEIAQRTQDQASNVRYERDQKLTECDWLVIKAYETNSNIPAVWELYRQALRDIPQQAGFPFDITWPAQP
jgi:hypothetical protein